MPLLLLLLALLPPTPMRITISNIREARGAVLIAVYRQEQGFLDADKAFFRDVVPVVRTGSLTVDLPDAPPGQYAVSCFHDLNGNGKLDKNLLGIPTEPYAFSNGARPKLRAPTWQEASITWKSGSYPLTLILESW